jgi:hypothetical protein
VPEEVGFFGHFFAPYMERIRAGELAVIPVALSDYLDRHPPKAHSRVQTGSWSAGTSAGYEFNRWAGTEAQQKAAGVIQNLSRRYWDIKRRQSALGEGAQQALARARALILEAQTSCFLFWGDSWIPHLYKRTIQADRDLVQAEDSLRTSQEGS